MNLSDKLKRCRIEEGMTQLQVADRLHVSRKTVSGWENDRSTPDKNCLIDLSNLYKVPIDSLLRDEEQLSPQTETSRKKEERLIKLLYWMNSFFLILGYFEAFRIAGFHFVIVPLFIFINIVFFFTKFNNWSRFQPNSINFWILIISFVMCFAFNIVLNSFSSSFIMQIEKSDANFASGFIMGRLVLLLILTFSVIILIFFKSPSRNE